MLRHDCEWWAIQWFRDNGQFEKWGCISHNGAHTQQVELEINLFGGLCWFEAETVGIGIVNTEKTTWSVSTPSKWGICKTLSLWKNDISIIFQRYYMTLLMY